MSPSVVAALACAVVAAIGTGVLIGRSIRVPRTDISVWACVLAALVVALGAQAYGAYRGYGSGTFRAVQFGAQLIAPLWLAWGLAELTAKSGAARFGAKLVTMALTVVTGVVLITDPLSGTLFSKSWPAASAHYQIIPRSLLSLAAALTLAAVMIALISALVRMRSDPAWRRAVIPITAAGAGAVVILGLRLTLPSAAYLALCAGCAVLTWFAGAWADKIGLAELRGEVPPGRADRRSRPVPAPIGESAGGEPFSGYGQRADAGRRRFGEPLGEDDWYRPASGNQPAGRYPGRESGRNGVSAMNGLPQGERGYEPDDAGGTGIRQPRTLGDSTAPGGGAGLGGNGALGDDVRFGLGRKGGLDRNGGLGGAPGLGSKGGLGSIGLGGNVAHAGPPAAAAPAGPDPAGGAPDQEATRRLYGLIAIYTLAEGAAEDFDALAQRVVEDVRANEPDALVYAVHSVPNADMQRIFYEVYRDRMAFEDHQRQPHTQRFDVERGPYVLATNVIELGMQQAKLSPLPGLPQLFGRLPGA